MEYKLLKACFTTYKFDYQFILYPNGMNYVGINGKIN